MLPISLRSAKEEQRYHDDKLSGKTKDISTIPPKRIIDGINIITNAYGYDLIDEFTDVLMGVDKNVYQFFMSIADAYVKGELDMYDHLHINLPHMQSQPQTPHCQGVKVSDKKIIILRELWESWSENNHLIRQ